MRKLFILPLLCISIAASAQFNLQFHYDLGRHINPDAEPNRQLFTATAEFFKADRLGSTFLFIDMDYRGKGPQNQGPMSAYWEMSREFTFAKVKETNSSFAGHIEYNGGLNNQRSFQQSVLVGPAWNWHSEDFNKTFSFQTLYRQFFKCGSCKAISSFQTTAVWGINFAKGLCTFSGYADLWYGYIPAFDRNGEQKKGLVLQSEPQFWFNIYGRERQNNRLSVGTELEISNNFIWAETSRTFYLNPTLAVKYTF